MIKNKRFTAVVMASVVGITTLYMPVGTVSAEEISETIGMESAVQDVTDHTTDTTESGDYIICVEEDADIPIEELENMQEIMSDAEESVYETDLTKEDLCKLEQADNILVEENFFMYGAKTKKSKEKKNEQMEEKQKLREAHKADKIKNSTEWNYEMIHADGAVEQIVESDKQVKIAVLDSGIELLSGIPVTNAVNLVEEESDLPYYMNDMTGHGTAVADIIHQICPQAQLYAVRVLDRENKGRLSDIVEGIYWCIEQDVDIINMSFGTPKESEILKSAIQAAADEGIMIIGSAGNGGNEASVEYPAAFEEVIAVGAVDTSAQRTEESTTGLEVELAAPGEQILTKSLLGLKTVNSGTSMAAPHVTGAAALLMQQDVEKDAWEIRMVLDASGNPLGDTEEYGYGLVDVEYAQKLLQEDIEIAEEICNAKAGGSNGADVSERKSVSTYAGVDYVEGRWGSSAHKELISTGIRDYDVYFNATEIKLLKAGSVYPDDQASGMQGAAAYPEWHGYYTKNYIAHYIFATKIARAAGNTENLGRINGQTDECYYRMKKAITKSKIGGRSWGTVIKNTTGLDYSAQSSATKKEWRRLFLYGMAAHTGTDAFAHSSYYKDKSTGQMIRLDHYTNKMADDVTKYKNRYASAEDVAYMTVQECKKNWLGDVMDFQVAEWEMYTKIYMGGILNYALQADDYFGTKLVTEAFKPHNCPPL